MKLSDKFGPAWQGLLTGLKDGSVIIQFALAMLAALVFLFIGISYYEWLIVVIMTALVILSEWLNSIVENVVDYISQEIHPQAKSIKDMSAALVLLAAFFAVLSAVLILINNIF